MCPARLYVDGPISEGRCRTPSLVLLNHSSLPRSRLNPSNVPISSYQYLSTSKSAHNATSVRSTADEFEMETSNPLPTSAKKRSRSEFEDDDQEGSSEVHRVPVGPEGLALLSCLFLASDISLKILPKTTILDPQCPLQRRRRSDECCHMRSFTSPPCLRRHAIQNL